MAGNGVESSVSDGMSLGKFGNLKKTENLETTHLQDN